jgi:hypothetical protein
MVIPRASRRVPMVQHQSSLESSHVWVPLTASDTISVAEYTLISGTAQ